MGRAHDKRKMGRCGSPTFWSFPAGPGIDHFKAPVRRQPGGLNAVRQDQSGYLRSDRSLCEHPPKIIELLPLNGQFIVDVFPPPTHLSLP